MTPDIVTHAVDLSDVIQETDRRHPFVDAVTRFAQLLATVPDYPPRELSTDSIRVIDSLAEDVISRIEQRVSSTHDPSAVQVALVGAVYDIRRRLEEIDRWHRHYASEPS